MKFFISAVLALGGALAVSAQSVATTVKVNVGADGIFTYVPNEIVAAPGSKVVFNFFPRVRIHAHMHTQYLQKRCGDFVFFKHAAMRSGCLSAKEGGGGFSFAGLLSCLPVFAFFFVQRHHRRYPDEEEEKHKAGIRVDMIAQPTILIT